MANDSMRPSDDEADWIGGDRRPPRSRRLAAIVAVAVVGVLLLLGLAAFTARERATAERRHAEMAWEEAVRVEQVHREMVLRDEADFNARNQAEAAKLDPWFAEHAAEREALDAKNPTPTQRALVHHIRGQVMIDLNDDYDKAIEEFRKAAELDPKYADALEAAIKRKAQRDRLAPPPRPVEGR